MYMNISPQGHKELKRSFGGGERGIGGAGEGRG